MGFLILWWREAVRWQRTPQVLIQVFSCFETGVLELKHTPFGITAVATQDSATATATTTAASATITPVSATTVSATATIGVSVPGTTNQWSQCLCYVPDWWWWWRLRPATTEALLHLRLQEEEKTVPEPESPRRVEALAASAITASTWYSINRRLEHASYLSDEVQTQGTGSQQVYIWNVSNEGKHFSDASGNVSVNPTEPLLDFFSELVTAPYTYAYPYSVANDSVICLLSGNVGTVAGSEWPAWTRITFA